MSKLKCFNEKIHVSVLLKDYCKMSTFISVMIPVLPFKWNQRAKISRMILGLKSRCDQWKERGKL